MIKTERQGFIKIPLAPTNFILITTNAQQDRLNSYLTKGAWRQTLNEKCLAKTIPDPFFGLQDGTLGIGYLFPFGPLSCQIQRFLFEPEARPVGSLL